MTTTEHSTLLICTVGGTPDPVVKALTHWRPIKVCFVPTRQTKQSIESDIVGRDGTTIPSIVGSAKAAAFPLDAGRYDIHELSDGEDFALCLTELHRLTGEVEEWVNRGESYNVVVDFTGGTKCMSAAVGLQASRWPCVFSYVGGARRTKEGVGIVEAGHERVLHHANPWDALGYQAVEDYVVLFDQHAFLAAANVAAVTMRRVTRPDRKSEFAVLEQLAKAFDAWDRFDHAASKSELDRVVKSANNLRAVLGAARGDQILNGVTRLAGHLVEICQATPPSRHHVIDLLANAKRRKDEGRVDDAVARLYRATEAIAQVTLKERHSVESTEKVPLERVPEALREEWASRVHEGVIALGLQDAYAMLVGLHDSVGMKFQSAGLSGKTSPLVVRNRSILAHGFERVQDAVFNKLWDSALLLADVDAASLLSFPTLAEGASKP